MSKRMNLVSTLIILFFLFLGSSISLGNEVSLTLIYTSNTLGEVEPCGTCPEGGDAGGMARRFSYIKKVREEVKNLLVLDGGDALVIGPARDEREKEKGRKRAEFVLKIYEKLGYHALNIGDTDLVLGVEYLRNLQNNSKIQFISGNLKEKKTGKPIFKPYFIKEMNGLKIGIIGLLTPEIPPYIHKELKGYFIEDPIKAAMNIINKSMAHCDYILGLAHLNAPEIEILAKRIPKNLIIIGGNERSFVFPKHINHSIYVQTDAFGLRVGKLNLGLVKRASEFVDILPRSLLQKNIEEIQRKMENPQYAKEIEKLKEIQKQFNEQLNKMPDTEGKNTFENHLPLMHPGMESDKEIEKLIDSSRDQLKRPLP